MTPPKTQSGTYADSVDQGCVVYVGAGSVYNATLSPPNNQCGTYTLRGTTPLSSTSDRTEASSLNITVLAAANATATSGNCAVQTQIDSSDLPSIAAPPVEASGAVNKWSPTIRPFSLQPVYLVQVGTACVPCFLNLGFSPELAFEFYMPMKLGSHSGVQSGSQHDDSVAATVVMSSRSVWAV